MLLPEVLTLLLDLPDLLHRLFENGTFVGLDVEVVDVVDVGEDQLRQLLDVFILLLSVAFLKASLGAGSQKEMHILSERIKLYPKKGTFIFVQ